MNGFMMFSQWSRWRRCV